MRTRIAASSRSHVSSSGALLRAAAAGIWSDFRGGVAVGPHACRVSTDARVPCDACCAGRHRGAPLSLVRFGRDGARAWLHGRPAPSWRGAWLVDLDRTLADERRQHHRDVERRHPRHRNDVLDRRSSVDLRQHERFPCVDGMRRDPRSVHDAGHDRRPEDPRVSAVLLTPRVGAASGRRLCDGDRRPTARRAIPSSMAPASRSRSSAPCTRSSSSPQTAARSSTVDRPSTCESRNASARCRSRASSDRSGPAAERPCAAARRAYMRRLAVWREASPGCSSTPAALPRTLRAPPLRAPEVPPERVLRAAPARPSR